MFLSKLCRLLSIDGAFLSTGTNVPLCHQRCRLLHWVLVKRLTAPLNVFQKKFHISIHQTREQFFFCLHFKWTLAHRRWQCFWIAYLYLWTLNCVLLKVLGSACSDFQQRVMPVFNAALPEAMAVYEVCKLLHSVFIHTLHSILTFLE